MLAARTYTEADEIDERLKPFGVTRGELIEIVRAVVAARAEAVADDPLSAEGLMAYIYGTRLLRQVFRANGWLPHRQENIEAVRHPERQQRVVYQSVDIAASLMNEPRAVSGKGAGADRAIDSAQGSLFPEDASPIVIPARIDTGIWFFCVSVNGDDVRAELSLPRAISGSNFGGFLERIFIVREGEWSNLILDAVDPSDAANIEPIISRK